MREFAMNKSFSSAVLTIGPQHGEPWWWKHLNLKDLNCHLDYFRISIGSKNFKDLSLIDFPCLIKKIIPILFKQDLKYIFTFQCGWASFIVSIIQTFGFIGSPKHIILQFIMREKEKSLKSRIKYLFMKIVFSSVHLVVCSSKYERDYYRDVFHWDKFKVKYVPFHTDPSFLSVPLNREQIFISSIGRTFRDYNTLFSAVAGLDVQVIIVASPYNISDVSIPQNVTIKHDIPMKELTTVIQQSLIVVLPLEDRKISIGQSVLLQAMAMAKPVIVTKNSGTRDYIHHMVDGVFVEPSKPAQLRNAIVNLLKDVGLRKRLGQNARKSIMRRYLPQHYFDGICDLIRHELRQN